MNITILAVGKLKEDYLQEASSFYLKRLNKQVLVNIIEINDEKFEENYSLRKQEEIKNQEGKQLLRYIKKEQFVIALAIEGKEMDSESFSLFLKEMPSRGKSELIFIIGGSLGLSREILSRADLMLSFSPMTFPHQLMRVILLEQLDHCYL